MSKEFTEKRKHERKGFILIQDSQGRLLANTCEFRMDENSSFSTSLNIEKSTDLSSFFARRD